MASFYLPVILTKQALKSASEDAGGATGAGCLGTQGWTAEWDYEQLVALQVMSMRFKYCCHRLVSVARCSSEPELVTAFHGHDSARGSNQEILEKAPARVRSGKEGAGNHADRVG